MVGQFLQQVPAEFRARIIQHGTVQCSRPEGVDTSQAFRVALHDKDPEAYAAFCAAYPPGTPNERKVVSRIVGLPPELIAGANQAVLVQARTG
jgi:hypothetical protein